MTTASSPRARDAVRSGPSANPHCGDDGRVGESRHKRRYRHGKPDVLPVSGRLVARDYERIRPRRERLIGVRGVSDGGENLPPVGPVHLGYPVAPSKTYADSWNLLLQDHLSVIRRSGHEEGGTDPKGAAGGELPDAPDRAPSLIRGQWTRGKDSDPDTSLPPVPVPPAQPAGPPPSAQSIHHHMSQPVDKSVY